MRKLDRNKELVEFVKKNPGLALREISEVFKISRQRVWEILKKSKEVR
jgi:predicted DNA-binding protein YlxM (UPF0122 family)